MYPTKNLLTLFNCRSILKLHVLRSISTIFGTSILPKKRKKRKIKSKPASAESFVPIGPQFLWDLLDSSAVVFCFCAAQRLHLNTTINLARFSAINKQSVFTPRQGRNCASLTFRSQYATL